MQQRKMMSAGSIEGGEVWNRSAERLGRIHEVMVDVGTGRIAYAILSFGGFLGFGDKLFAIPWEALSLNEDQTTFVLNVDKSVLENAPGFDIHDRPNLADPEIGSRIFKHYGYSPYWKKGESAKVI